jgi:aspartyl/asparaginyl-tRNA synthetase
LGQHISSDESCLGSPADVFIITHFPKHLRACNIHPAQDGDLTHSFDVIIRGQECVTGCQLLHSHDELRTAFATREPPIDSDSPGWRPFVAAHEIGMPPWGGFGRKWIPSRGLLRQSDHERFLPSRATTNVLPHSWTQSVLSGLFGAG